MPSLLGSRLPIVAAPMAGGPTTVALTEAATRAGAFAFLAAGNKTVDGIAAEIEQVRDRLGAGTGFGVNLFVPPHRSVDVGDFAAYAERLRPEAETLGVELDPRPQTGDDHWREKIELLVQQPVAAVSLTFGLPDREDIARLQDAGSRVIATVTGPEEARAAAGLGVDALTVQGYRAGGHSAVHDPRGWPGEIDTAALVRLVRESVALPLIAAGGVDGPEAVHDLLDAGAEAVAVGTLLLRSDEAGTTAVQRAAMVDPSFAETALSRAFTGRPARGLRNGFVERHAAYAPSGYPEIHYLTRGLRQAAAKAGDAERLHMWAGTGYRSAPSGPVADIIAWLTAEGGSQEDERIRSSS